MDLIKKFLPKQKTIQSFKVDPQGFRKTINENPPTQEFFKNPPEGAEHGQKCIESKKINTLYYKKPAATPTFSKRNFSSCFFWLQVSKIAAKLRLEKNDISDMVHPRKISLAESWGSSRFFIVKKVVLF